jgi:hypothetical protein
VSRIDDERTSLQTATAIEDYTQAYAGRGKAGLGTAKQRAANNHDGWRRLASLHIPVALTEKERLAVAMWLSKLSRQVADGFGVQNNVRATRWVRGERPL